MLLRPKEIEIPAHDPFANDALKRQRVCETLTDLAENSPEGLVVAIHSPWGTGKSTFLRMWQQHLRVKGFRTLSFNAWQTDFSDDALVALIGELEIGLTELKRTDEDAQTARMTTSIEVLKKAGTAILKRAIPVSLKLGTAGLLDLDEFAEDALSDLAEKIAEDKIRSYESARNSVASFRKAIEEAALVATELPEGKAPLIFIIDELDRCRPSYAVRVLECIKHFFAVPGVLFVLAIDRKELCNSIAKEYGQNIDAPAYLRRFFDLELVLPEPKDDHFIKAQFERFELAAKFDERNGSHETSYDRANMEELFGSLFRLTRCSLRDQERCFTLLSFAMKATPKNHYLDPYVLSTLIVLKVKDSISYEQFTNRRITALELLEHFQTPFKAADFVQSDIGLVLEALLQAACHPRHDSRSLLEYYENLSKHGTSPVILDRANRILGILQDFSTRRNAFEVLDRVVARIDLVQSQ